MSSFTSSIAQSFQPTLEEAAPETILVVDDTPDNLYVLEAMLTRKGFQVSTARDGNIALSQIEQIMPDLILLDIRMPGLDGYEVCDRLKQNPRTCDIPVIFISAIQSTDDKVKAFEAGGVDYITKPFQLRETLARVESHMRIRRAQKQLEKCDLPQQVNPLEPAPQAQASSEPSHELAKLNYLKEDFLSTISHELRTPLFNILLGTDVLEMKMRKLNILEKDKGVAHYLGLLNRECQREIKLVNDLLEAVQLDADEEPLLLTVLNLRDWLPHAVETFETTIKNQNQSLQFRLASDLLPFPTDLDYLEPIVTELLQNACKFSPEGATIAISAKPRNRDSAESPLIEISVSNSGVEIPASEFTKIFDKFYRIPSSDPWKHGGTGLGLTLVQKRVKKLNGTIVVTSAHNWTTFTVTLPQIPDGSAFQV